MQLFALEFQKFKYHAILALGVHISSITTPFLPLKTNKIPKNYKFIRKFRQRSGAGRVRVLRVDCAHAGSSQSWCHPTTGRATQLDATFRTTATLRTRRQSHTGTVKGIHYFKWVTNVSSRPIEGKQRCTLWKWMFTNELIIWVPFPFINRVDHLFTLSGIIETWSTNFSLNI